MKCPTCGSEVTAARFCENCGAALPEVANAAEAQQVQPTEVVPPLDAQPTQASPYTPDATQQMPQGAYQQPASGAYQQPASGTSQQSNPGTYQQPAPNAYQAPPTAPYAPTQQATVSSTAFVLAIVGLILAISGIGVIIGLVLCIVALVLNSKNNKSGLANPHKTSTTVISVIGLVISGLVLITTIMLGALIAEVYGELEANDFDLDRIEISVDEDTGEISIEEKPELGSGGSIAIPGGAQSSAAAPIASSDTNQFDGQGNPTLCALTELTGQQLVDAIESAGFEYDDAAVMWSSDTGAFFYAEDDDDDLTRAQTVALGEGGTGSAVEYNLWTVGYDSPQAMLTALSANVTVIDTAAGDRDYSALRVSNARGSQFIAIGYNMEGTDQLLCLFPETAITSGLFADELDFDNATTMDTAWTSLKKVLQ